MAHFRGILKGDGGEVSRLGTTESGLYVEANGWTFGVRVRMTHRGGKDHASIYLSKGSSNPNELVLLGDFTEDDLVRKGGKSNGS